MISSKILIQSAAAGLMAGAILTMPLFVFDSDDTSFKSRACPYASAEFGVEPDDRIAHFEAPVLRAAPGPAQANEQPHEASRRELREYRRSLAERNRAANAALQNINKAYERSDAHQRGVQTAHTVALDAMARQTATRINRNTQVMTKCRAENFDACKKLQQMVVDHQFGLRRR